MDSETGSRKPEKVSSEINLRSEEVGEILGRPPGWIVRWGTGVAFAVILVIITGSGFFRYPDIVRAPVVITQENPPSVLTARVTGKPEAIFRTDGSVVRMGDTLAVIENPARYHDIFRLGGFLAAINQAIRPGGYIPGVSLPAELVLGEVQPSYNLFAEALNDYKVFIAQDFYESRIAALQRELEEYNRYRDNLGRQKILAVRDLEIGTTQFRRDSLLFESGIIPASEYEQAQALLLSRQKTVENAELALYDAGITIARLERSIADTRLEKDERQQKLFTGLVNSFRQLESSLAYWENRYLIKAPTAGTLNYLSVWSSLQELREGDPVFSIVPDEMGELHARVIIPFRRAGKVKPGQRVNIRLDGYPYMEFGMVEGRIRSVSGGPVEQGFPAVIELSRGTVTSFGYQLEITRELPGTAEISTDELSLLERLVSPVRHLLRNHLITSGNN